MKYQNPTISELNKIKSELLFVSGLIEEFQNLSENLPNIAELISLSKPELISIRNILGYKHSYYIKISDTVVSNALEMLIPIINETQERYERGLCDLIDFKIILNAAINIMSKIGELDMSQHLKSDYLKNYDSLLYVFDFIDKNNRFEPHKAPIFNPISWNSLSGHSDSRYTKVKNEYLNQKSQDDGKNIAKGCLTLFVVGLVLALISLVFS